MNKLIIAMYLMLSTFTLTVQTQQNVSVIKINEVWKTILLS